MDFAHAEDRCHKDLGVKSGCSERVNWGNALRLGATSYFSLFSYSSMNLFIRSLEK